MSRAPVEDQVGDVIVWLEKEFSEPRDHVPLADLELPSLGTE